MHWSIEKALTEPFDPEWRKQKAPKRNRSNNRLITFNGKTQPLIAWAEETGIDRTTIARRLKAGWSIERSLMTAVPQKPIS